MAKAYIGKNILVRSPETCALVGENYCQYCVSKLLSENPDGIKNDVTEVTSIVMYESMKKMHNTTKSISYLDSMHLTAFHINTVTSYKTDTIILKTRSNKYFALVKQ